MGSKLKSSDSVVCSNAQMLKCAPDGFEALSKSFAIKRIFWFQIIAMQSFLYDSIMYGCFGVAFSHSLTHFAVCRLLKTIFPKKLPLHFLNSFKMSNGKLRKICLTGDIAHHFMFKSNCSPMNSLIQTVCLFVSTNEKFFFFLHLFLHRFFVYIIFRSFFFLSLSPCLCYRWLSVWKSTTQKFHSVAFSSSFHNLKPKKFNNNAKIQERKFARNSILQIEAAQYYVRFRIFSVVIACSIYSVKFYRGNDNTIIISHTIKSATEEKLTK